MKEKHYNGVLAVLVTVLWGLAHIHFIMYETIFVTCSIELIVHKHVVKYLEAQHKHKVAMKAAKVVQNVR